MKVIAFILGMGCVVIGAFTSGLIANGPLTAHVAAFSGAASIATGLGSMAYMIAAAVKAIKK